MKREPDFHLPVTIESQIDSSPRKRGIIFKNIPCQIFLPQTSHEQVIACLQLKDGQAEVIGIFGHLFWKMSIKGWLRWGGTLTQVQAKDCYIRNGHWPKRRNGCNFQQIDLPLEVLDLQIVEVHQIKKNGIVDKGFGKGYVVRKPHPLPAIEKQADPVLASFWLTSNHDLLTARIETSHHNGSIEVKELEPYKFELLSEVEVTFNREYSWHSGGQPGQYNRREKLIANVLLPSKSKKPLVVCDSITNSLDDFLLLISFSTRWNTICLGWNVSQWPYLTKKYRHGRMLPQHLRNTRYPVEQDYETGLILPSSLPDFLRHAWPLWKAMDAPTQEMLRHVLQAIVHAQSLDLQSGFISHYATLEMMVLHFRRNNDLEFIFSDLNQWQQFESELRTFISEHALLSGSSTAQKNKRKKAYDKIGEFNRVAFTTAFDEFCSKTSLPIPHQDLWPVNGKGSLSKIRNNLVHGVLDGRDQVHSISIAKSHLQWLVERCVLCLLSWPVEESRVAPENLSHLTAYNKTKWEVAKSVLFSRNDLND